MKHFATIFALGFLPPGLVAAAAEDPDVLSEVVVTASLRRLALDDMAASVTVLGAQQIERASVSHLQDLLPLVPNLNWAAGTSRPRYFQLRGIGETEQWQGAPNSSVGFLIDDIDFSGVGMPAGSFDLGQVEVLRGPQGTSFGANALAGLIAIRGRDPRADLQQQLELTAGNFGTRAVAALLGGELGDSGALGRIAIQQRRSDGFRRNVTLNRDDTNDYDETLLRAKLRLDPSSATRLDLTVLGADLDNGYDAFALDNSRITRSDQPGRDRQRSVGVSAVIEHALRSGSRLRSVTAYADSDILYSFDGDWTAAIDNDFTSSIARTHRVKTQDLRWLSADRDDCRPCWVAGAYVQQLQEDNEQLDLYNAAIYRQLQSAYTADSAALYAQADVDLGAATRFSFGLRREQRRARYEDTDGTRLAPRDRMTGGQVTLARTWPPQTGLRRAYLTLARGYKAGGFNVGAVVPDALRAYGPEYLWSAEIGLGVASADDRWRGRVAAFAMRRRDQQVARSLQIDPADPLSFLYLTSNAGRGRNDGLEAEWQWSVSPRWAVGGSLGLLKAQRADGRDQEHAPRKQIALALDFRDASGWFMRVDGQHVARFFFSDSHDQVSTPYTLVGLKVGLERERWAAELWVRNALNDRYSQRGFFFGNEPPDYPERLYLQQSDPRQLGLSVRLRFGATP
jgi:outer membrane receptor protein involved in Fe transport